MLPFARLRLPALAVSTVPYPVCRSLTILLVRHAVICFHADVSSTPPHHATPAGHLVVAHALLQCGAPIDVQLLSSRRFFDNPNVGLTLLDEHAPASLAESVDLGAELVQAASEADPAMLRMLLRWGADPTSASSCTYSPVHVFLCAPLCMCSPVHARICVIARVSGCGSR